MRGRGFSPRRRSRSIRFGSESYGLALLTGPAKGAEEKTISAICVYDKHDKTVEIGGELPGPEAAGE